MNVPRPYVPRDECCSVYDMWCTDELSGRTTGRLRQPGRLKPTPSEGRHSRRYDALSSPHLPPDHRGTTRRIRLLEDGHRRRRHRTFRGLRAGRSSGSGWAKPEDTNGRYGNATVYPMHTGLATVSKDLAKSSQLVYRAVQTCLGFKIAALGYNHCDSVQPTIAHLQSTSFG